MTHRAIFSQLVTSKKLDESKSLKLVKSSHPLATKLVKSIYRHFDEVDSSLIDSIQKAQEWGLEDGLTVIETLESRKMEVDESALDRIKNFVEVKY